LTADQQGFVENLMSFSGCANEIAIRALTFTNWNPDIAFDLVMSG
jgi:hypothetical protein